MFVIFALQATFWFTQFFFILKMSVLQALSTVRLCRPRGVGSLLSVRYKQAWSFGHPTIDPRRSKFGVSGFQFSAPVSTFLRCGFDRRLPRVGGTREFG